MAMTEYGRKRTIERLLTVASEAELKQKIGNLSDSSMRDPEIYATILRLSRSFRKKQK